MQVGDKTTITMADGRRWPAIQTSETTFETVTVTNRATSLPVDITVSRANHVSLRRTKPDPETGVETPYLTVSSEVENYGFRPITELRFSTVVGLDATEDGEKISLQSLLDAAGEARATFLQGRFEARKGITAADAI